MSISIKQGCGFDRWAAAGFWTFDRAPADSSIPLVDVGEPYLVKGKGRYVDAKRADDGTRVRTDPRYIEGLE